MATPSPPRLPAGERIRRAGIAAWSIIGLVIVLAGIVWLLMKVRIIFPPLLVALVLIYLLNPVVTWLSKKGMRRGLATLLVYVVSLLVFAGIIFALVPVVSHQVSQLTSDWPEIRGKIVNASHDAANAINSALGTNLDADKVDCVLGVNGPNGPPDSTCSDVTQNIGQEVASHLGRIVGIGFSVLSILVVVIIGALVSLYLLIDLPQLQRDLLALVPQSNRDEARDLASKAGRALGGFFRGQLLVALIVGTLSAFGFWVIGLPFWFFIGAIAGFFNLVPLVGPFIGGGIGFLVGVTTGGIWLGVSAALVELVVQQIDNHIISPNVIGRSVRLHPVTIMLSLLAGGAIAGFWGIFLAVPLVAMSKIVLYHLWVTRILGYQVSPYEAPDFERSPPSVAPGGEPAGEIDEAGEPEEDSASRRQEETVGGRPDAR